MVWFLQVWKNNEKFKISMVHVDENISYEKRIMGTINKKRVKKEKKFVINWKIGLILGIPNQI